MPNKMPDDDDDDYELELEPVDPEVLAHDRQRGEARVEGAVSKIDVDELYRESDYSDLNVDWNSWKQIRFTTKHLLMLTAMLALVLTLRILLGGCNTLFIIGLALVAGGWVYVMYLERQQEAVRARRREEFYAAGKSGEAPAAADASSAIDGEAAAVDTRPRFDFKVAFSLRELFITMTVAAVAMAFIRWLGAEEMAVVLGLIALGGLIVQASGFDPPRPIVLGWWILLLLYLGVGLIAAVSPG
jgi:hypothetical protein